MGSTRAEMDKMEAALEVVVVSAAGVRLDEPISTVVEEEEQKQGQTLKKKKGEKEDKKVVDPVILVQLECEDQRFKTSAKPGLQIEWKEKFKFSFRSITWLSTAELVMEVHDRSKGYDMIVGKVSVRVAEVKSSHGQQLSGRFSVINNEGLVAGELVLDIALKTVSEEPHT